LLHTLGLFDTPEVQAAHETAPRNRTKLLSALNGMHRRYGKNALHLTTAHGALDHAPMRIAFNRVADIETEL
jgi:DNA polymerase IV